MESDGELRKNSHPPLFTSKLLSTKKKIKNFAEAFWPGPCRQAELDGQPSERSVRLGRGGRWQGWPFKLARSEVMRRAVVSWHGREVFSGIGVLAAAGSGWRTWAPVASVAVASLALLVAVMNRATARKALALSEQQEERRQAKLDLSLKDAISYRDVVRGQRWIGVEVLAVNPTDRDGAVIAADLHVSYRTNACQLLLKVPHQSRNNPFGALRQAIEVPTRLPANGAISGWLLFRIDDGLIEGVIDRFDIAVSDSRGLVEVLQTWALTEVNDATTTDH